MNWPRARLALAGLATSAILAAAIPSCQSGSPAHAPNSAWTPIPGATYVGEETCASCHDAKVQSFARTSHGHAMLSTGKGEDKITCENCHGPGSKHVDAEGDPRLILKGDTNNCFVCHKDKKAEFSLQYRHPVKEGRMGCSSCHDLHAPEAKVSTSLRINETCTSCHQEKAGPWTFEHEATRDGCIVCHKPHGSMNQKLLAESEPHLCLKCHYNSDTYQRQGHYRHKGALNPEPQDCAGCHQAVHGSNFSKELRTE
ncbi:MAG: hypothetical protein HZA54_19035 [Planctomycetes bacterium]|nr:hypothetical protein [Planctomycetota bacterium]